METLLTVVLLAAILWIIFYLFISYWDKQEERDYENSKKANNQPCATCEITSNIYKDVVWETCAYCKTSYVKTKDDPNYYCTNCRANGFNKVEKERDLARLLLKEALVKIEEYKKSGASINEVILKEIEKNKKIKEEDDMNQFFKED